jgi:hypothetical protein
MVKCTYGVQSSTVTVILMAFPPGTFSHVPLKVWQFAETRDEEVVFQISSVRPTAIEYLNAADDPRKSNIVFAKEEFMGFQQDNASLMKRF